MSAHFEEIDRRPTRIGEVSLRRRWEPMLEVEVHEVRLDDAYLMSSLFTTAEVELARLGLARASGPHLDVVVGGLGLGYTARAVLEDPRVRTLHVVEALEEVIEWHQRELLPLGADLNADARCELVAGDFFAIVADGVRFGPGAPDRVHAVLVDIDHSPDRHLHPSHAAFYEPAGLRQLADHLHPGGVFALWSDDPPDDTFVRTVKEVFASCEAQLVTFPNPYTGAASTNSLYVATLDQR